MRKSSLLLAVVLVLLRALAAGQSLAPRPALTFVDPLGEGSGGGQVPPSFHGGFGSAHPFSRLALGGGFSTMGINMQAATNLNAYMNLRAVGNYFDGYQFNNLTTNGFSVNLFPGYETASVGVDIYPFPRRGFRLSPGVMIRNDNHIRGDLTVLGGTQFTLNNVTYYASSTAPISGQAWVLFNRRNPAMTLTTGWGNMIPRRSGQHWSFPFEAGVAFVGAPLAQVALYGGQACDAQGLNCVNVATDPTVQANLAAQVNKFNNDIKPFGFYPIVSGGVAYSFKLF